MDLANPVVEPDSSGNVANVNVFAPDGLVGRKEGSTCTNYTFDPQGNVVHKLNSGEAITAGRLLDAWGTGVETTLPRNIDPYGYNAKWGYYYDRETALYLCQRRMYDASAGRWLNRDPLGYAGGMNLYSYCAGGPVGWADPTGETPVQVVLNVMDVVDLVNNPNDPLNWIAFADPGPVSNLLKFGRRIKRAHDAAEAIGDARKATVRVCEPAPALRGRRGGQRHREVVEQVEED